MLGHKMFQRLRESLPDVWCTVRRPLAHPAIRKIGLFHEGNVLDQIDAADWESLQRLLAARRPGVIVNCVGVIKQRSDAKAAIPSITLNALLPHRLAELSQSWGGRLIHFSTDCVFSGKRGNYSEEDFPDAEDLYGRTKLLGEVTAANALTLRTSIIGRELSQFKSLLEWFLSQNHRKIMGYTRAFYSGVTTNYLAGLVARIILQGPKLSGLYQVTSATIAKYELLCLLRDAYGMDVEVQADDKFFCDRSMRGNKFIDATGYRCPPWPDLVAELSSDPTPYEQWRSTGESQEQ